MYAVARETACVRLRLAQFHFVMGKTRSIRPHQIKFRRSFIALQNTRWPARPAAAMSVSSRSRPRSVFQIAKTRASLCRICLCRSDRCTGDVLQNFLEAFRIGKELIR